MVAVLYYPRFFVEIEDIQQIWGKIITYGYKKIIKTGIDEDSTTLAINTYYELNCQDFSKMFLIGNLNYSVFKDAIELKESDRIKVFNLDESEGINALIEFLSTPKSILIGVTPSFSHNNKENSILGQLGLGIYNDGSVKLVEFSTGVGTNEFGLRYNSDSFDPTYDTERLNSQKNLIKDDQIIKILTVSNLKLLTKFKNVLTEFQAQVGFLGNINPIAEFINWLDKAQVNDIIDIYASDPHKSVKLTVKKFNSIHLQKVNNTRKIDYEKLLKRDQMGKNPAEISQGAFISESLYYSQKNARYLFQANQCTKCNSLEFPPRQLCRHCGGKTETGPKLSRTGTLYTFTKILRGAAPTEFDFQQQVEDEYGVGIIEFPEGPRIITQITDINFNELSIGDKMKAVFRKIYTQNDVERYGNKFIKIQ